MQPGLMALRGLFSAEVLSDKAKLEHTLHSILYWNAEKVLPSFAARALVLLILSLELHMACAQHRANLAIGLMS